uniref:Protein kinase domain-containing protein n=1 Tax=Leersia perrieri TaxID=77586 RepID=A0A0D9XQF5_9ORYZ
MLPLVLLLFFFLRPAAANTLSTFAMAKAESTTIVCALLPSASSPLLVDLNCTEAGGDHQRQETYPSSHPFSALAGGDHFLCAVGPAAAARNGDAVAMRWWDLSKSRTDSPPPETNSTANGAGKSKRVYLGPPIKALSSGGYRVCGVLDSGELHCWRWLGLKIPDGLRFASVAVGDWFVCAIEAGGRSTAPIRCFGNDTDAVAAAPRGGSFDVVAAHGRRACALSSSGEITCWGAGAPAMETGDDCGYAALALGADGVCGLRTNGTIRCFGSGGVSPSPPASLAAAQYVEVQAHGSVFCGVLMANYSLVCWGGREFNATNRLVFDRVLPGPCENISSCKCGVLPGSANLCADGRCICVDCAFELNIATPNSTNNRNNNTTGSSRRRNRIIWLAVAAGAFLILLVALQFAMLIWCRRRRRSRRQSHAAADAAGGVMLPRHGSSKGPGSVVEHFTIETLHAATDGFSDERRIGSGSFGSVYRGTLTDGREVAIKRAEEQAKSSSSARPARRRDRETAFSSELTALARANHKNIVCLLGCCSNDAGERVLVYEYMANGTLHDQLHNRTPMAPPVSTWRGRLTIALDAARGIEYMHVYAVPNIIHRDVKSANILLDDTWTAKIADFGLSSVLATADCGGGGEEGSVSRPMYTGGTVGYMDPEYYRMQHLTDKSDVYSFGVVLLELMSGCRVVQRYAESVTPKNVVEFAVPRIVADEVSAVLDPRLPPPTPHEADALAYVGYLAADCVGPVGCDRPSMTEVVDALERALAACTAAASPVSRSGAGAARRVLSRSGTDQFDLTDTD